MACPCWVTWDLRAPGRFFDNDSTGLGLLETYVVGWPRVSAAGDGKIRETFDMDYPALWHAPRRRSTLSTLIWWGLLKRLCLGMCTS